MFVLAHLSDPHLATMPQPRLAELAGKRALGFANWVRRRRRHHLPAVLEAVVRDIATAAPDHIAVTGDLVNIALPGEFAPARTFLAHLGPPQRVTFVPGNHDAYVRATARHAYEHWGEYMRGDADAAAASGPDTFPFVRRRDGVVLVGLSTAVPTAPFMATGRLGADQLRRLEATLARLGEKDVFRVVLLHHPPVAQAGDRFKRLIDADALRQVLRRRGADLVLHGHAHVRSLVWVDGPRHAIPVIGVPSASAATAHAPERAGYNLYRIGAGRCEMVSRAYTPGAGGLVTVETKMLAGGGA